MFIALEGTDNAGKTTIGKLLADKLNTQLFEEIKPTSKLRDMINNPSKYKDDLCMTDEEFKLELTWMFMINRSQYQADMELMYSDNGNCLVIDRYTMSTLLYGAFTNNDIWRTHAESMKTPDLTVIISPSAETIIERCQNADDDIFQSPDKSVKMKHKFEDYYRNSPDIDSGIYGNVLLIRPEELSNISAEGVVNEIVTAVRIIEKTEKDEDAGN